MQQSFIKKQKPVSRRSLTHCVIFADTVIECTSTDNAIACPIIPSSKNACLQGHFCETVNVESARSAERGISPVLFIVPINSPEDIIPYFAPEGKCF